MASSIVGIELGKKEIKFALWNGSAVKKLFTFQVPEAVFADGTVSDPDLLSSEIRKALKEAGIFESRAALVLPGHRSYLIRTTLPYMNEKQLEINLPYEFKDFLTESRDKYYFDSILSKINNNEEGKPETMEIYAAAILKEQMEQYKQILKKAGLKLVSAMPGEMALTNLIRNYSKDETVEYALLGLDDDATRIDFFTGSSFISTKSIDEGYQSEAGSEKETYERIAMNIRRSVNFYGYSNRNSNIQNLHVYGSGALIEEYVRSIGEAFEDITVKSGAELLPPVEDASGTGVCYFMAIGATLQSTKAGLDTLNLLITENKAAKRLIALAAALIVIAIAAVFGKFFVADRYADLAGEQAKTAQLRLQSEQLDEVLTGYQNVKETYDKYTDGWKTEAERAIVNRTEIIDMINEVIGKKAASIQIIDNTVTVRAVGVDLEQASTLMEQFNSYENVLNAAITNALSKSEDVAAPEVTFIIQMAAPEGGKS